MKKIAMAIVFFWCMILLVSAASSSIIVEEQLNSDGYHAIEVIDGKTYEVVNAQKTKLRENRAATEVLRLPLVITTAIYKNPDEVKGIVEDIPFNYFASPELAAEYVYSLFNDGFLLTNYTANSLVIQMELQKNDIRYRILIYEDYLKVYAPESGG